MKKKTALRMVTMLLAAALFVGFVGSVYADQEAPVTQEGEVQQEQEEEPAEVVHVDDWSDSQKKMIASMHWLTKPEVEVQAVEVPLISVKSNDSRSYEETLDNNDRTSKKAWQDVTLQYQSETHFERIYVKLEFACLWTVTLPDGSVKHGGESGFIHELLELDQSVTSFELNLPEGTMLCDVYAFTSGKLPSWVQVWEPPCENADFLVLPTHADDEHLWFGGVLPYYAGELGYKVQVVYMTNHYNQNVRSHELLNGLWLVGVRHYPIISDRFMDYVETLKSFSAASEKFGYNRVLEFQVEMLRRFSPKVVIAHDIHGEYGHGAHILNARTLLEALPLTEDASVFPDSAEKYGTCKVQKCYLHLWRERPILMEWRNMPLARFDDVSALEMAVNGFHCHVSQLGYAFYVSDSGRLDCRKFGLAYTTVGDDTPDKNDMLENVVWTNGSDRGETASELVSDSNMISSAEETGAVSSNVQNMMMQSETVRDTANEDTTRQNTVGQNRQIDFHNDRLMRLLGFIALTVSGVVCAMIVTTVYAKRK